MKEEIPICPGALRILMDPNKKKAKKKWNKFIKDAYKGIK